MSCPLCHNYNTIFMKYEMWQGWKSVTSFSEHNIPCLFKYEGGERAAKVLG
jgi:hypothetical protein